MIDLAEARSVVLAGCTPLPVVRVPLRDALGLVSAEPVTAPHDVPPFDNTAVDGFAVRAADTAGPPATLTVVATLPAGTAPAPGLEVGEGEAVRIMTGAPMPPGADAAVMVERTTMAEDGGTVVVHEEARPGDHVRGAGDDFAAGAEVLRAGVALKAGHLGVLASIGATDVAVHRRPVVGVLSTGDELAPPGATSLRPGQIRDSNRPTLLALVEQAGCHSVDLGIAPDDEPALKAAFERAVSACDAVLTSGGVSVGDFDYVKVVLDELSGGAMRWMQVAIKPAKPLAFGVVGGVPVFGLPGNPVSSMVSFELFARPGLRRLMGHPEPVPPLVPAVAGADLRRAPDGKTHFVRVVAAWEGGRLAVRPAGGQGSHMLRAMAGADALAMVPDGDGVSAGAEVEVLLLP